MVTPFTVSLGWLEIYRQSLRKGLSEHEARLAADKAEGIVGKTFARCRLDNLTLTVPVEGGASVLKRRDANPILSEHGKWRREHLGAFDALYHRTPFYEHLMPEIEEVYVSSEGLTLEEFNSRLLEIALRWLDIGDTGNTNAARFHEIRDRMRASIIPGLSIFDAIFRLGKTTGLGMIM